VSKGLLINASILFVVKLNLHEAFHSAKAFLVVAVAGFLPQQIVLIVMFNPL
jgi:hypothetical protein